MEQRLVQSTRIVLFVEASFDSGLEVGIMFNYLCHF
jgi:hypothetical protein